MQQVNVLSPAKVNLFLGIGARRDDGYHDATTVMHALAMHDTLRMTLVGQGEQVVLFEPGDAAQPMRQMEIAVEPGSALAVSARTVWSAGLDPIDIPDEDNLACRAVQELARVVGRAEDEAVRIVIQKKIPHQTGLAGGSSNAAAALLGAAKLWGLDLDDDRVEQAARALGADVAFFLHGGCALLEGTGSTFVRALSPSRQSLVVIKPEGGVSTAQAYATFDDLALEIPDDLLERAKGAEDAADVPLFNNLAPASEQLHDQLAAVRSFAAERPGVEGVLLCGSGSGTFAVCDTYEHAAALSAAAQAQGWWARATSFAPLGASVLPG